MGKKSAAFASVSQSSKTVQPVKRSRTDDEGTFKYLENSEIQALFRVIKSKRDRAIFRLVYHRGLRAHEVGLIELADFRDRDGVLFVTRGKGSISREHSLTDEERHCLRAWIKQRGIRPGPMFPSRQGRKGISRKRLDQLMKKYCTQAGIRSDKAHMHALKHSCGTILAENGLTAEEIQDHLGHRSSHSTDIYMHFSRVRRADLAERLRGWS
jgi:integrase